MARSGYDGIEVSTAANGDIFWISASGLVFGFRPKVTFASGSSYWVLLSVGAPV